MGFNEAKEDGIRYSNHGFMTSYFPPCEKCGDETMSLSYIRGLKYICSRCKTEEYLSDKAVRVESSKDVKERKFENAVKRMHDMGCHGGAYERAGEAIHAKLFKDGWFDSTEEIMTAIELVRRNVKARHQVKFGRYRADFVLPDEKVVLEVDGRLFHSGQAERERLRDELIVLALGPEWEVVRISDNLINQKISKLLPAIRKVKQRRASHRAQNGGKLPGWYSNRE